MFLIARECPRGLAPADMRCTWRKCSATERDGKNGTTWDQADSKYLLFCRQSVPCVPPKTTIVAAHEHQEGDKHAKIGDAAGARRGDANEEACEQPKEFSDSNGPTVQFGDPPSQSLMPPKAHVDIDDAPKRERSSANPEQSKPLSSIESN